MSTGIFVSLLFLASTALAEPSRIVRDAPRNHLWVLQQDAVYLHDATTRALKKRFELPGWLHVDEAYACAPALAVDAQGVAVVSSNIVPILWRIDPRTSEVSTHELTLDADNDKDVGFSGLTYAPDQGVFFGVSSVYGSLWRIDPLLRRAQRIPLSAPIKDACGLAVERSKTRRTVVLCARAAQGALTIHLAPDQRSAYVRSDPCLGYRAERELAFVK
jgi:hypothetical protein